MINPSRRSAIAALAAFAATGAAAPLAYQPDAKMLAEIGFKPE